MTADGRVLAVCVAGSDLFALPGRRPDRSGIDKRPAPGRVAVGTLGLDGDVQVNRKHHGGEGQAVYCYADEDAQWWAGELDRELPAGRFGENLRTDGIDLGAAEIGERWQVGTALCQVSYPRIPCATFERFWRVPGLVKRFTERGATGAYLRVLEPGDVGARDAIRVVHRPGHGISTEVAFRALTTRPELLPELGAVLPILPANKQDRIGARIATARAAQAATPV